MPEVIVSELLKVVLEKLTSEALKKIVRSLGIQSELKKLETKFSEIQEFLNDASQREVTDKAVKRWLNSLQHLAYDIDDIIDGLATDAMESEFNEQQSVAFTSKVRKPIPTCCTNYLLSETMSHKLDSITKELQDLELEKTRLGLIVKDERPKNINRGLQTSLVDESTIVGREFEKQTLIHKLLTDEPCNVNYRIVPIVVMGGVGKTTLARLLYKHNQVKDHFQLKAWVCVSDDFDSFSISKVIFQSIVGENKEYADFNLLQEALEKQLMGKRFLLVLDDVWSESYEDWVTLVAPFRACAPGSKIIMTTRKNQLLNKLGYNGIDQLKSLSHDDAMTLFAQHALDLPNFDSHPTLKPYGEGIMEKCGCLPLALTTLGRLLRTKDNEEDYWRKVLNSEIWRLEDEGGIVPALRLSYNDLSACLKRLFAYCSLFPKGYIFDNRELVLLWMGKGFLHHSTPNKLTEEQFGHECFNKLFSRSFFQHAPNDKSLFVMHDLMNDLATSVAGEFFVKLENEMENDKWTKALEKYRHMSFVRKEYESYNKFEALKRARNLRTFMATSVGMINDQQRFYLSNKILVDLLPKLTLLRVLNLSKFEINELPESIGSLRHLRYLNLSRTPITQLPENVCYLYNLQTLILFGCYLLCKLPNNFSKLRSLRHFDTRDTPLLNKMPLGIGKLQSLQTLSKIIIGAENRFRLTELKELKNLCGNISIKGLDKVQIASDAREANFLHKRLIKLELTWSDVFDGSRKYLLEKEVLDELKPHNDALEQLNIVSYGGIQLSNWVADPSFARLSHVSIRGCKRSTSLPTLGQLPSVEELFIEGMDGVNNVGVEFLGTGGVSFPLLKTLTFENMKEWESWSTNSGVVFPCLEKLVIRSCPNLVQVSIEALPSLRNLEIRECDHNVLTSLVHSASLITELKLDRISGLTDEVWRGTSEHLRAVEELTIMWCDEIRYLWESEAKASRVLVSLRKLNVADCNNLESLGEMDEGVVGRSGNKLLTSLKILEIKRCKSIERGSCPNNIERLSIYYCDSITNISFSSGGGWKKLKSLEIFGCKKVIVEELGGYEGGDKSRMLIKNNNEGMPLLKHVQILHFPNLKFIRQLNCFVNIATLNITSCQSLESFPDQQLPYLTSLKHLAIYDCPRMDSSFPRGLWPPKLQYLTIGGLKKPISEWGPQNFPLSLVNLTLFGGAWSGIRRHEEYDSISDSQLSHLLPPSLTSLWILKFKDMETISMGLQHLTSLRYLLINNCPKMKDLVLPSSPTSVRIDDLDELETISVGTQLLTSLQHLHIQDCPKMKNLPEMLLPSLLGLRIIRCPKLNKRCSKSRIRRGSYNYWPLISHIPKIDIQ
ncbi:putative disease resistance RPP13-like protein 1 [Rutidosis leptorrhynchoides]|uniref:putative disease resistance RPP13-like protein 1 n=1 Tax=Rutidosis leptorrhynchoides TaxID=125765 RepID=UPI003A99E26D